MILAKVELIGISANVLQPTKTIYVHSHALEPLIAKIETIIVDKYSEMKLLKFTVLTEELH